MQFYHASSKSQRSLSLRGLFAGGLFLAMSVAPLLGPLQAQAPDNAGDPSCVPPANRIRVFCGIGNARIQTGYLSEGTPAWTVNSFIDNQSNELAQPVIPIIPPKPLQALSLRGGLDYTYKDRLVLGARVYYVNQEFDRDDTTRITFYAPPNRFHRWALFEGVRLQRYVEDRRTADLTYLHPVYPGIKVGPFVEREQYIEVNDISLGSFKATKGVSPLKPFSSTWSELGRHPGMYRLWSWNGGATIQLQLFQFLALHYKGAVVNRDGDFKMSGYQILTEDTHGGVTQQNAVFNYFYGELKDTGSRHNVEAIFTFLCRYGIHLGFLYENFDRKYSLYLADSFLNENRVLQQKTPMTLGIGEMMKSHRIEKTEVYLKFSAALFWE